jgi:hypothetical protein
MRRASWRSCAGERRIGGLSAAIGSETMYDFGRFSLIDNED